MDLFELAEKGDVSILTHPSVATRVGSDGWTPLHALASSGKIEVLTHPSVATIVDKSGRTPLHALAREGKITAAQLREKYPWFKFKGKVTKEVIDKLISTPKSVRWLQTIK